MVAKKQIAPELLAEAKRLYEQTLAPVDDIAGMLDLSRSSFYVRVREGGWRGRRASTAAFHFTRALSGGAVAVMTAEPAEQPRADVASPNAAISDQQRMALALRMQQVVEREMDAVERILGKIQPSDQIEAEHGARTLASVARTLREIKALNTPDDETPPDDADDDPIPCDIDEFRFQLARRIRGLSKLKGEAAIVKFLTTQKLRWIDHFDADFHSFALRHQRPPEGDWTTWLILGGRGAGKTRAGAEWVRELALNDGTARIALVGETEHDAREVMVEGISGVLAVHRRGERPQWIPSRKRLEWSNGAVAQLFSADDPEQLRGAQFSAAWADELAKWRHADEAAPFNSWRAPREALDHYATFMGFDS